MQVLIDYWHGATAGEVVFSSGDIPANRSPVAWSSAMWAAHARSGRGFPKLVTLDRFTTNRQA